MLGQSISDPLGVESPAGAQCAGLNLLPVATEFAAAKATHQVRAEPLPGPGFLATVAGTKVTGYEIHMGHSQRMGEDARPLFRVTRRSGQPVELFDGAVDAIGRIWGTYLHGLFDNTEFRRAWLRSLGWSPPNQEVNLAAVRQASYDRLAAAVRSSLDMGRLRRIVEIG
jgi:adenosylcobyric acid synthase